MTSVPRGRAPVPALDVDRDPGVPEAGGRAVADLLERIPAGRIDTLWRFPPLRKGRKESGLLAAGLLPDLEDADPEGADSRRRVLVTLAWRAEETGKGVVFETAFLEEGEAPAERLPRVMEGVVRRMDEASGEPRYLFVGGDARILHALQAELTADPDA